LGVGYKEVKTGTNLVKFSKEWYCSKYAVLPMKMMMMLFI
jgi:hypothetical protein